VGNPPNSATIAELLKAVFSLGSDPKENTSIVVLGTDPKENTAFNNSPIVALWADSPHRRHLLCWVP
jgi:hypothetical protein